MDFPGKVYRKSVSQNQERKNFTNNPVINFEICEKFPAIFCSIIKKFLIGVSFKKISEM